MWWGSLAVVASSCSNDSIYGLSVSYLELTGCGVWVLGKVCSMTSRHAALWPGLEELALHCKGTRGLLEAMLEILAVTVVLHGNAGGDVDDIF